MNLEQWQTRFLEYCRLQKNLSEHSLKAYQRDIDAFLEFLKKEDGFVSIENITDNEISRFFIELYQNKLSPKSLARVRSSLNNLFEYIFKHKGIVANPVKLVKTPKIRSKLPEVLDVDTVSVLLNIPLNSEVAIRDKSILELFYSSGLRLSELSELKWHNLDFNQALITVTGKGNKQRVIPVGQYALKALKNWKPLSLNWNRTNDSFVFISKRGSQLKSRSIQARIKFWAQNQGLWERVYPHLLRHSFASHVLESSGNLRAVQEMLGHADISTTQIYTHLNYQHLANVYDKSHPRARKNRSISRKNSGN
ncbi:MAG: tyrosine recombinase XerC [Gammaproteobacteria bacterium]|jgi:integrase/recombinase XerC